MFFLPIIIWLAIFFGIGIIWGLLEVLKDKIEDTFSRYARYKKAKQKLQKKVTPYVNVVKNKIVEPTYFYEEHLDLNMKEIMLCKKNTDKNINCINSILSKYEKE